MFSTLECFRIMPDVLKKERLTTIIEENVFEFSDFHSGEKQRVGFCEVVEGEDPLYIETGNLLLFRFKIGVRKPDSSLVKETLAKTVKEYTEKGIEFKSSHLKKDIADNLLNKSTPKFSSFLVMVDFENEIMYVDSSGTKTENMLVKLNNLLGGNVAVFMGGAFSQGGMNLFLTDAESIPEGFHPSGSVSLIDGDNSKAKLDNISVYENNTVKEFMGNGGECVKLSFNYDDLWSFNYDSKGNITGLKPTTYIKSSVEDYTGDDDNKITEAHAYMTIMGSDFLNISKVFKMVI